MKDKLNLHNKLTVMTTIRLSNDLKINVDKHADRLGISFSDFVRQSILRNMDLKNHQKQKCLSQKLDHLI